MVTDRPRRGCVRSSGFTLVELLVVVAIIALLVTILMPSPGRARDLAMSAYCQTNMKTLASTQALYCADNDGKLPWAWSAEADEEKYGTSSQPGYGRWNYALFLWPYHQSVELYTCPSFDKAQGKPYVDICNGELRISDTHYRATPYLRFSGYAVHAVPTRNDVSSWGR